MTRPVRIRVLRAATRLNIGGPALHVAILSTRLDPDRFETLVVAGREGAREGRMEELGRVGDLRVRHVDALGRDVAPLADARALGEMYRAIREFRPHIVHTHLAKAGTVGRVAAWAARVPVIVHTYHGTVFSGYFGGAGSLAVRSVERALARITTRVVAISPRQRRELISLGIAPAERIAEIPLGLDLDAFLDAPPRAVARAALDIPPDVPVVVIVGRLVPIKDVSTFLRAVAIARQDEPGLHALVVGDGEEREKLESEARSLGLGAHCRFLGWRADVPTVYAASDVAMLTSLNEGSPVSVIEAMAAGRVVIATAVGGVPDVLEHGRTGVLAPPADPAAVAAALRDVLSLPDRGRALGDAARAEASGRFAATRLVRDIETLYDELLAGARPG